MGILRYVVQGFGWEVGRQVAKEGMDALSEELREKEPPPPPTRRELKAQRKEEARRNKAIEAELRRIKKAAR